MAQQTRDFKRLNEQLLHGVDVLLASWLPGGKVRGSEFMAGDIYGGTGDSLKVNVHTGKWADFANPSHSGGDLISLYATIHGISQADAYDRLANVEVKPNLKRSHTPEKNQAPVYAAQDFSITAGGRVLKPTYIHRYADPSGTKHPLVVCRYDKPDGKKTYRPYALNGSGYLAQNIPDNRPLYNLDLITKHPDKPILVVEGEKAADIAAEFIESRVVTTWAGGASAVHKADWTPLQGRDVLLWPDNDRPGVRAAEEIQTILKHLGAKISVIVPKDKPEGWDAADAFEEMTPKEAIKWLKEHKIHIETPSLEVSPTKPIELVPSQTPQPFKVCYWKSTAVIEGIEPLKHTEQKKIPPDGLIALYVAEFLSKNTIKFGRDVFTYNGKHLVHWSDADHDALQTTIQYITHGELSASRAKALTNSIISFLPAAERNPFEGNPYIANFLDGTLELTEVKTKKRLVFREHRLTDYCLSVIPMNYNVDRDKRNYLVEKMLVDVTGGDNDKIRAIKQMYGAILIPFKPRLFMLVGQGGSGKSTVILVGAALRDKSSVSNCDPANWSGFNMAPMVGKLVNIDTDIRKDKPIPDDLIKKIQDRVPMHIDRKYAAPIFAYIPALHIFGANEMPATLEYGSGAHDRRWTILRFEAFDGQNNTNMDFARHIFNDCPEGVLNLALEGLEDLIEMDAYFVPDSSRKEVAKWQLSPDSVGQFIEEAKLPMTDRDGNPIPGKYVPLEVKTMDLRLHYEPHDDKAKVERKALWNIFSEWHREAYNRPPALGRNKFYDALAKLGFKIKAIEGIRYITKLRIG